MTRGWCPSVHAPMDAPDGLLARIKPSCATLTADAAMALADAVDACGNGVIQLTNRANLQIRGLSVASAERFAEAAVRAGLAHPDPAVERRRNMIISPLAGPDVVAVARAIESMLACRESDGDLRALPPKFGFVVDDGGFLSVFNELGDVFVRVENAGALIWLDGSARAVACPAELAAATVRRLLSACSRLYPGMRARLLRAADIFAAAELETVERPIITHHKPTGIGEIGGVAFGVGAAFGQMTPPGLRALAVLSRGGNSTLRITPWRTIVLPGLSAPKNLPEGFTADPADTRLIGPEPVLAFVAA